MRALFLATSLLLAVAGCTPAGTKFTGVEPNTGTYTGGEEISLVGTSFPRSGAIVKFGNKEAASVVFESDSKIRVTTPAGDPKTNVDITLIFDDGRAFQLKNGFRYMENNQRKTMENFMEPAKK